MNPFTRRNFLKAGVAAGALASVETLNLRAEPGTATSWVTLGKSDLKVTRLALGTGTFSGKTQQELGQEDSRAWSATLTIAAFAFLRPPSRMASRNRCWAWR